MTTVVSPCPLTDDFTLTPAAERILQRAEIRVVSDPGESQALADGNVLLTGLERQVASPREYMHRMPELRWIHTFSAGLGPLASEEVRDRRLVVTNSAGVYAVAIAEYVFASLVLLARGLPRLIAANSDRMWLEHTVGHDLSGQRVGVIGYGAIGRQVGRLCTDAGMNVWGLRRRPTLSSPNDAARVLGLDQLDELLASCDMIVVSASLNPTSAGLLGHDQFRRIKPGAMLVNVGRGALINEDALVASLRSGRLGGAILDVTTTEPLPPESRLWGTPNLCITPHISGTTVESAARALDLFVTNLEAFLRGDVRRMVNLVDLDLELASDAFGASNDQNWR